MTRKTARKVEDVVVLSFLPLCFLGLCWWDEINMISTYIVKNGVETWWGMTIGHGLIGFITFASLYWEKSLSSVWSEKRKVLATCLILGTYSIFFGKHIKAIFSKN